MHTFLLKSHFGNSNAQVIGRGARRLQGWISQSHLAHSLSWGQRIFPVIMIVQCWQLYIYEEG